MAVAAAPVTPPPWLSFKDPASFAATVRFDLDLARPAFAKTTASILATGVGTSAALDGAPAADALPEPARPVSPGQPPLAQPPFLNFIANADNSGLFDFGIQHAGARLPPDPKHLVARMGAALNRARAPSAADERNGLDSSWPGAGLHQPFVFHCLSELPELVVETSLERQRQEALRKRQARLLSASGEASSDDKPLPAHISSRKFAPLPPPRAEKYLHKLRDHEYLSPAYATDGNGVRSNSSTPTTAANFPGGNNRTIFNSPGEPGSVGRGRKGTAPGVPAKEPPPMSKLDIFLRKVVLPRQTKAQRKQRFKDLGGAQCFDDLGNPTKESGLSDDIWTCFFCLYEQVWGGQFWKGATERDRKRREAELQKKKARDKEAAHVHGPYCQHHSHVHGNGGTKNGSRAKSSSLGGDRSGGNGSSKDLYAGT